MSEQYPIPIAKAPSEFTIWNAGGWMLESFHWDLKYVSQGQYQLRGLNNKNEVMGVRGYNIEQILNRPPPRIWLSNSTFTVDEREYKLDKILPVDEQVFFMLQVFLNSSPYYIEDGRMLDFCDECGEAEPLHDEDGHEYCSHCSDLFPRVMLDPHDIIGYEDAMICDACERAGNVAADLNGVVSCIDCNELYHNESDQIYFRQLIGHGENYMCEDCVAEYYYCEGCDRYGNRERFIEDDYGEFLCETCVPQIDESEVRPWNWRPESFIYHPAIPSNPLKPLYIGMELEFQWSGWEDDGVDWIEKMNRDYSGMLYFKHDSSVDEGFELVTHPMEPDYALKYFPWDELNEAIDAGAWARHASTGIHIHIDRGAFSTAQLWKFLKLHDQQRELCGIVGGRGCNTTYADWDTGNEAITENAFHIARKKGQAFSGAARYVPINLKNEDTIELRYMEGTLIAEEVKKNIQWVQALYDFTDHISVEDIKNGVLAAPGFMLGWVIENREIYPSLAGYLDSRIMAPMNMPERV